MHTSTAVGSPERGSSSDPARPVRTRPRTRPVPRVVSSAALVVLALPALLTAQTTAFTGATVWDGTGAPARTGVTLLVEGERISAIGANVSVPESATVVPLDGKFVMPGLINVHGHVSGAWATDPGADPRDRIRQDLLLYARYGITSVVSLGDDRAALEVAGSTTTVSGAAGGAHARLRASGPVVTARTPDEARRVAEANVDGGADWLKLRVDDNLGTSEPMPWPAVEAVLDVGRERGVPVATHLFYLEDARRLLEMGTGLVAHSVRDVEMDASFLEMLERSGVCYVPTLTRELSTFVYERRPDFFDDPFFQRHALAREVRRLEDPAVQEGFRVSPTASGYREALEVAHRNLILAHDAGVPVAFGTDSGPSARFPGYFEHLELWMMVDAGMSPADALRSATAVAAACGGLEDVGTLEPGQLADFLVLDADPTRDIRATRSLERVFVGGREVEGVGQPGGGAG
ncbi:MAG: amidohydrolase family protein [Gemmatimonadota bacterium]